MFSLLLLNIAANVGQYFTSDDAVTIDDVAVMKRHQWWDEIRKSYFYPHFIQKLFSKKLSCNICDVIKQNEWELANTDFKI